MKETGTVVSVITSIAIVIGIGLATEKLQQPRTAALPQRASRLGAIEKKIMRVTAYCPCRKCCGKWADGFTASNHKIQPGDKFAAAPADIPFRTMLIVPGYNDGKPVPVLDRGGALGNGCIDVFFDDHEEALEWGVKWLKVKEAPCD